MVSLSVAPYESQPSKSQPHKSQPHTGTDRDTRAYLYDTTVQHVRTTPLRNTFAYRSYSYLVDLDHLPRLPWPVSLLSRFEARDHLGEPTRPIRANVEAFLAGHGIELAGGQIRMLASARTFGYVFNPLSVFWCHDSSGELVCVVAEVHNTYGERHAYLLRTDDRGRASTAKQFYVSPFYPVDGDYQMSLPEPGAEMSLTITLHREEGKPFVATVRGTRRRATVRGVLRSALRVPLATWTVAAQIRYQGVRLWLRRLRVVPRSPHRPQKEV